jgi:hypothetical protein
MLALMARRPLRVRMQQRLHRTGACLQMSRRPQLRSRRRRRVGENVRVCLLRERFLYDSAERPKARGHGSLSHTKCSYQIHLDTSISLV